jgi:small GTP-binding protein
MNESPHKTPEAVTFRNELIGHSSHIFQFAWSPDGISLAAPSADKRISVWDPATGKLIRKLIGHEDWVRSVTWSPDGRFLASGSADGTVRLWDIGSGKSIRTFRHNTAFQAIAWSPDGKLIASASGYADGFLRIWDVRSGNLVVVIDTASDSTTALAWSPTGTALASAAGFDAKIHLWDSRTWGLERTLLGHSEDINDVKWSASGHLLASASDDKTIQVWDVHTGGQARVLKAHTDGINSLSFSNDGQLLASGSYDGQVLLWRCDTWEPLAKIIENASPEWSPSVAFDPKHSALATLSRELNAIHVWDLDVKLLLKELVEPTVHYTNAKVVLVGEASTGKTCLGRALIGKQFSPQESTHGMQVWTLIEETKELPTGPITRETMLWDLAGQTEYQVVHQLFLDETALGIVLFDSTHPESPFSGIAHWEKALRRAAGDDTPLLLVAGRIDRGYPTATAKDIDSYRLEHRFAKFIPTSAKTGEGIEELRQAISRSIPWYKLPVTTSPELWKDIREFLIKSRETRDVLTRQVDLRDNFKTQRPDARFTDIEFETVLGHAQAQGLVKRLSFGNFVLLRPEILNDYASAVVREARRHEEGLGCVRERSVLEARLDFEDLNRIGDQATERTLLHAVVELFLEREVALREGELLVFPSKFNRMRPDYPEPPLREVAYRFSGPVEDIYATLVVRLFYSGAFDLKDLWKNAAEFKTFGGMLCGFVLDHENGSGELSIFFERYTPLEVKLLFLRFIHDHLHRRSLPESAKRERIYRCPECSEEIIDRRAVEVRLRKGKTHIPCQICDDVKIPLIDLLEERFGDADLIRRVRAMDEEVEERKEAEIGLTTVKAKRDIGEFDVFLCYNNDDRAAVSNIGRRLIDKGILPWLDEWELRPGLPWQRALEDQIGKIKSAAVFVGSSGLGPWHQLELEALLREFAERNCPVIPVILENIPKKPALPIFLKGHTWVDFAHKLPDPLEKLIWGITGQRQGGRRAWQLDRD